MPYTEDQVGDISLLRSMRWALFASIAESTKQTNPNYEIQAYRLASINKQLYKLTGNKIYQL